MRFSIIIPVYNVEKYIRKCMETVMEQTFRDYEVIVVDDESPDNSMRIVEEFAEKYPGMITMIHQKNTRQGGARNHGVQIAQGDYLIFVDSDDYVALDMLERIDAQLTEHNCDILVFKYHMVSIDGAYLGEGGFGQLKVGSYIPTENPITVMLPVGPWNKAFRRSFYLDSGMQFPEKLLYEDAMTRFLYAKAGSVVLYDESLYFYVQSNNSSIRQKPSEKMLDILTVTDLVIQKFTEAQLYATNREALEASLLCGVVYVLDLINEQDSNSALQKRIAEYIAERFPEYKQNKWLSHRFRKSVDCIVRGEFVRYHYIYLGVTRFREWLLCSRVISKLNNLRKR